MYLVESGVIDPDVVQTSRHMQAAMSIQGMSGQRLPEAGRWA